MSPCVVDLCAVIKAYAHSQRQKHITPEKSQGPRSQSLLLLLIGGFYEKLYTFWLSDLTSVMTLRFLLYTRPLRLTMQLCTKRADDARGTSPWWVCQTITDLQNMETSASPCWRQKTITSLAPRREIEYLATQRKAYVMARKLTFRHDKEVKQMGSSSKWPFEGVI